MPEPRYMTLEEYAKHRGITRQAVVAGLRRYKIPTFGSYPTKVEQRAADLIWSECAKRGPNGGPHGPIHPTAPDTRKAATVGPAPASSTPGSPNFDQNDPRWRKEIALADLAELRVERERGRLVDVAAAAKAWHKAARTMRDRVLGVAVRIAPDLAACDDVRETQRIVEREIRVALESLADDLSAASIAAAAEPDDDDVAAGP